MVVIKSDLADVEIPEDRNVTDWMLQCISDQNERKALINSETDRSYTYSDLKRLIPIVSHNLRTKCGVKKGDVMCIFAQNSPEYAILLLAALQTEAIITGVNPGFAVGELKRQLDDGEVTFVFTQPQFLHKVQATGSAFSRLKGVILQGDIKQCHSSGDLYLNFNLLLQAPSSPQCIHAPGYRSVQARNTVAILPYSSGTTGLPKGVMISHYNLVANLIQMNFTEAPLLRSKGEILVEYAPLYHVSGLVIGLFSTLLKKGTMVIMPSFDYHVYLKNLEKYRATFLKSVPPILLRISKDEELDQYDLSSLQTGSVGSAPTAPNTLTEASRKLRLTDLSQGWGMSETTCTGSFPYPGLPIKPASVGKLPANTEAKIVDPESLRELKLYERGELWLRGPQVMLGYWRKPQQTRETITSDGWLRTGDIAYFDNDHYLFIVDRLKELIKVKGFQVAPAELEAVLLKHPGVLDTAVVGVKDEVSGELPRAYIVLRESHRQLVTATHIHEFVNGQVARYKQLRGGVIFTKEIPKSPTGKTLRRLLTKRANRLTSKL